jgi:pimeloyl-ACP methyl ester carboxylesterase
MAHDRLSLSVDDTRLEVLRSASKGPPVLLCHSNSTSATCFAQLLDGPVGERYALHALSFPGHGSSDRVGEQLTRHASIPGLAELIIASIAAFGWSEYALVGHSLGGHVLLEALERLPGARGLMLVSAPPIDLAALGKAFRPDPSEGLLFKGSLSEREAASLADCLLRPHAGDGPLQVLLRRSILQTDPAFRLGLGASLGAGQLLDERAIAQRASVSMALAFGSEDVFLAPDYCACAELGSPWRGGVHAFEGAGHSLHLTHGEAFAMLLRDFLGDCLAAPSR